jgi:GNAT superfamily N-acetyltransferase
MIFPMTHSDSRIELVPRSPDDQDFVYRLFCAVKTDELQAWSWSEAERELLMSVQFRGHEHHYRQEMPDADDTIVHLDGEPIGRMIVERGADAVLLADLSLLPAFRNRGIGGELIRNLQREADARGVPLRLHCAVANPAGRLYCRLGFLVVGENETHRLMEWRAAG